MSKNRNSNLELYRIIVMLLIVAHHYVVNSGLMDVMEEEPLSGRSIFFYLFGAWGKTSINCFLMITGYFMCTSRITIRKFLKLLLEVEFYKITIYAIFMLSGYETFSVSGCIKSVVPILSLTHGFTSCFLVFYLCIPFLNILVHNMNRRQHGLLVLLCLFIYTVHGTLPWMSVSMNYVSWFCVLYFIASYIRLYITGVSNNVKTGGRRVMYIGFVNKHRTYFVDKCKDGQACLSIPLGFRQQCIDGSGNGGYFFHVFQEPEDTL